VRVSVVAGNPRPASRTLTAALHVVRRLSGDDASEADLHVLDLATLGPALLDRQDATVARHVERVAAAELVVVASPTYKGSFTGLVKVFLDLLPHRGLEHSVAVPVMLGASPGHALAVETALRPVLTELGATVPASLFLVDSAYDDPATYAAWGERTRPLVHALVPALVPAIVPALDAPREKVA
jgi:FMN reductase